MGVLTLVSTASVGQLVGVSIAGLIIYNIALVVYRLTLHPLAKYPGPFLSRISYWPMTLQCLNRDRHLHQFLEHDFYGDIVRTGPDTLSINSEKALKVIYANAKVNTQKSWWYSILPMVAKEWTTHSTINREIHSSKRRIMSNAFSDKAVRDAEHFILENIRVWLKILGEPKPAEVNDGWSKKRDMSDWSTYLGVDVMGDLAFGKSFNCLTSDENRWVPEILLGALTFVYFMGYLPILALFQPVLGSKIMEKYGGKMAEQTARFTLYVFGVMDERIEKEQQIEKTGGEVRKDFCYYLLAAKDPETGKGYSRDELRAEAGLLTVAGADTTAVTLAACQFYLVRNPRVLARLTKEVRETFSDVEDIRTGSTLNNIAYLRAVIDEALRMSPPLPGMLPREVLAGGITIDNLFVPPGTQVGTSAYCIHHNEEYYPDSFAYKPERWIVDPANDVTEEDVARAHSAFCAFSLGSRGCIGKGVAYVELSIALARMVYLYDLREATGESEGGGNSKMGFGRRRVNEYQLEDRFVSGRQGPILEFKARA